MLIFAGLTSLPSWCSAGFAVLSADLQDSAQNSPKTIKSRNKIQKKSPWAVFCFFIQWDKMIILFIMMLIIDLSQVRRHTEFNPDENYAVRDRLVQWHVLYKDPRSHNFQNCFTTESFGKILKGSFLFFFSPIRMDSKLK